MQNVDIKMDWVDAVEQAKEEMGYYDDSYIENWDSVTEAAQNIMEEDARFEYSLYLKGKSWKIKRWNVLFRDGFKCRECNLKATEVHHTNYDYLKTEKEELFCLSLCRDCHQKIHNKKKR